MRRRGRPRHPDILTPREWQVLALIQEGKSNDDIAERLSISLPTVKYHVSEILGKLGVESRHEAARWNHKRSPLHIIGLPLIWLRQLAEPSPAILLASMSSIVVLLAALLWGLAHTEQSNPELEDARHTAESVPTPDVATVGGLILEQRAVLMPESYPSSFSAGDLVEVVASFTEGELSYRRHLTCGAQILAIDIRMVPIASPNSAVVAVTPEETGLIDEAMSAAGVQVNVERREAGETTSWCESHPEKMQSPESTRAWLESIRAWRELPADLRPADLSFDIDEIGHVEPELVFGPIQIRAKKLAVQRPGKVIVPVPIGSEDGLSRYFADRVALGEMSDSAVEIHAGRLYSLGIDTYPSSRADNGLIACGAELLSIESAKFVDKAMPDVLIAYVAVTQDEIANVREAIAQVPVVRLSVFPATKRAGSCDERRGTPEEVETFLHSLYRQGYEAAKRRATEIQSPRIYDATMRPTAITH
jgi:DNA-binding CsgD family transcriptional regulator